MSETRKIIWDSNRDKFYSLVLVIAKMNELEYEHGVLGIVANQGYFNVTNQHVSEKYDKVGDVIKMMITGNETFGELYIENDDLCMTTYSEKGAMHCSIRKFKKELNDDNYRELKASVDIRRLFFDSIIEEYTESIADDAEELVYDYIEDVYLKYRFTGETKKHLSKTLHRIIAVSDFADVQKGDRGGWIESERNLSQQGTCWVYNEAIVTGNAMVLDDATIKHNAEMAMNSILCDDATVLGTAVLLNNATVGENALIVGNAIVSGNAMVMGSAVISGSATIDENAFVGGRSTVSEQALVDGSSRVFGNADIDGFAKIRGKSRVFENAKVEDYGYVTGESYIGGKAVIRVMANVTDGDYIRKGVIEK